MVPKDDIQDQNSVALYKQGREAVLAMNNQRKTRYNTAHKGIWKE